MTRAWLQDGLLVVGNRKKWQGRRKIITPAFHFKILEEFMNIFEIQADILINTLRKHVGNGGFDICNYLGLYTLDVICMSSMGVKINAQTDKESDYVNSIKAITKILVWRQSHFLARDNWYWKITTQKRRFDKLVQKIHNFTISVIENRIEERKKLDPINEDDEYGIRKKLALLDILLDSKVDGVPLTITDIQEEVDNFMFAGHETTTSAMEFLLYCLAKYPTIQEKVYHEIMAVFGDNGDITLSKINNLQYLDLVIKETLRLYPPVPLIARYLREDVTISECFPYKMCPSNFLLYIQMEQFIPLIIMLF